MSHTDKAALITGGAVRVGRAIALHLARQGWSIAIHYRHSREEADETVKALIALGVKATSVQADFAQPFDATALFTQVTHTIGPIDCLINSAAIIEKDTLETADWQHFHDHLRVNAFAPLALIQAYAAYRKTYHPSPACVINLTDGTYGWSLSSKFLSYALSKHTLANLTEMLAVELAPYIRINAIGMGPTLPNAQDPKGLFERHAGRAPTQEVSSPEEVCRTIDYLLAAPNVTGQQILLTGGLHCINSGA